MMKISKAFSTLGVLTGLSLIAGGLWHWWHWRLATAALITGILLLGIHASSIASLEGTLRMPRWLLIAGHVVLLVFFVLGQIHIVGTRLHSQLFLWGFGLLFLLPLAVNAIYWIALTGGKAAAPQLHR